MTRKTELHRIAGCAKQLRLFLAAVLLCFVCSALGERVNFAKFQKASASGQSTDYAPEFAVDGIVSNFHAFRTNNATAAQWLEVAFPRSVTIASAHLYLGLDNDPTKGLPSFKFQYHNGTTWLDVPGSSVTGNTATERSVIFTSAATSTRFRLYTNEDGNRYIRELALFPPNLVGAVEQGHPIGTDVRLNLAYKRPAVASSISGVYYPKLAVDGYVDDASRWLSSSTPSGQTLDVDLLQDHAIGSAHVYSGFGSGSALANFTLQYWTGSAWLAIPGATITGNTSIALVVTFSSTVTTSKIRLVNNSASAARVKELLVFPPRVGGYPPGQDVETGAPPTGKWDDFSDSSWRLKNGGPDLRLALVDGAVVFVNNTSSSAVLEWQLLLNHRDGSYRLRHVATGNCLAQGEISTATGKAVVVEPYTGMPHQDWMLDDQSATQFRLINVYSGLALYPRYGVWDSGNTMVVSTPSTSILQLWQPSRYGDHPKKGLAGYLSSHEQFNVSWSYHWGRSTTTILPSEHTFNPMQWGDYNWTHGSNQGPLDLIRDDLQSNPKPVYLMGFNEPDHTDQANMTTDQAIALWPRLEALDAPLIGPCPATPLGSWGTDWEAKADAQGFRRDYTPYHWYAEPNVGQIISALQTAYTTFGRPVWLTEFSTVSWNGAGAWTEADNYNFLAEFMWRAESLPWLKRYSLFQFTEGSGISTDPANAPRSNTWKSDGTLTPFGELYAGWDGVTSVLPDKAYHLHNRGGYDRIQNPATSSTLSLVDPGNSAVGTRWILSPGVTANSYRIHSTRDGRPIRYFNGTGGEVGLAPASQTTGQVDWRLVADQDGWYFIDHPATNKRLKDNGNGTFSMVAITTVSDEVKWRFVVPAVEENVAPLLATISPKSVNEGALLSFTASGTDADLPADTLTYSLIGAPEGAAINPSSGAFTWTPTEAQGPGVFNFTVQVSDGSLTSDQAVSVTVNEANVAPVLASISAKSVNEGVPLSFTASASDGDLPANTLTYSLVNAPNGATIGSTTGAFSWTPTKTQGPGSFNFTARVSDGALTHDQVVAVTVLGVVGNPGDDVDGDGVSNLVEYALGTSQTAPSPPNRLPLATVIAGKLTLVYRRPVNGGTSGVVYALEKNANLSGTWTTSVVGVDYSQIISANGDGSETVTATFLNPITPGTKQFIRLALSQP